MLGAESVISISTFMPRRKRHEAEGHDNEPLNYKLAGERSHAHVLQTSFV